MAQTNANLEKWLKFVFDHPVTKPAWYWNTETDYWVPADDENWTPETTVEMLTETFMGSGEVLLAYSDAQVNDGLNYLVSGSCSDWMHDLLDDSVPWADRKRCIQSIYTLFEQCFAKRCSTHLSHLDERGANPLNAVCYMWWDVFPSYGQPDVPARKELDAEFLSVMKQTLYLNSDACCESALHGFGHWQMYYPEVTLVIDEFLEHRLKLRPGLKAYALQARTGYIQ